MSNWLVAGLVGVSVAITIGCSTAAAADDPRPAVSPYTMSPGRLGAVVAGLVGLTGVVIGGRALRSAGRVDTGNGRSGAVAALVAGLIGMALGGLVVTTADGGIGTGNGLGGGVVAFVVGLTGMVLGGLALARSRRRGGQLSPIPTPPPPAE
ncbi:hypothetical protein J0H58_27540 [bacterium]|nr:hypothetical protein [bacterium]